MANSLSETKVQTSSDDPFEKDLEASVKKTAIQMGCWTNSDDFLLISSVLHLCNLEQVHKKVKFSMDFSLENIQDRWKCILYHAPISKMIIKRIQQLTTFEMEHLKIPLNEEEEKLLSSIRSDTHPTLLDDELDRILSENSSTFWENRSISELRSSWQQLCLDSKLIDQIETETQEIINEEERERFHRLSDILAPFEFELLNRNNELFQDETDLPVALIYMKSRVFPIFSEKVTFGTDRPDKKFEITLNNPTSNHVQGFFFHESNDFYVANDGDTAFRVNGVFLQPKEICFVTKRAIIQIFDEVMAFHQIPKSSPS